MRPAIALALLCLAPAAYSCAAMDERRIPVEDLARAMTLRYQERTPSQWFERGPGIVGVLPGGTGYDSKAQRGVALTLDACGGKTDMRIIALLRDLRIPAAIFVTNPWLRGNADLAADLAADPLFSLEAHGARHKPASVAGRTAHGIPGTANIASLVDEVESNARAIAAVTGKRPRWYRSGAAFYDDVALLVIRDLGFSVAGFSISADQGGALPAKTVARLLLSAKDGDILLIHVNRPESDVYEGLKEALPQMTAAGIKFVAL
ncbi:MAG: polysaccharide deacetylase family protein [Desulfovibrionaceae bacterium]|nr:polysaccharide deacetylase family protein [Desulfovibrionaceae bacterium]